MEIRAQKGFTVNTEDRIALAAMLVKWGYRVEIVKEVTNGKGEIYLRVDEKH